MAPLIYVVWIDVPPGEPAAEFSRWYIVNHAPNLIDSGFLSVRHCRSLAGRAPLCTFYEIPGHQVFGEHYEQSHQTNAQLQRNVENFADADEFFQTIYEQLDIIGAESRPATDLFDVTQSLSAPVIVAARFSGFDPDRLIDWHHSLAARHLHGTDGFVRSRVARRTERQHPHPVHRVDDREYLVLVEWTFASVARAMVAPLTASLVEAGLDLAAIETNVLHNRYSLLHPEAWHSGASSS